jgi:hypothetical protein
MSTKRKPKRTDAGATGKDQRTIDEAKIAFEASLVFEGAANGCDPIEVEKKLGKPLTTAEFVKAFADGKAQLHWDIMKVFKAKAMEGDVKAIQWFAENILKKNIDAQTGSALIDCMTIEQRRERIRELTKKLSLEKEAS